MKYKILILSLLFCACAHTTVEKSPAPPVRVVSWQEIEPYVGRHIGMRPNASFNFVFDIGSDFGPMPANGSVELDGLIQKVLLKRSAPLASVLIDLVKPGVLTKHRLDAQGHKIPLTTQEINEGSQRLWQAVLNENPPVALTHIKFLLARDLQGQLQIEGMDLKPTLSAKRRIEWTEVKPYVASFFRLTTMRQAEEKGKEPVENIAVRVCMGDNNVAHGLNPTTIDWRVAMAVFDAMSAQIQGSEVFNERIDKFVRQKRGVYHLSESDLSVNSLPPEEKKKNLALLEESVREALLADYAFKNTMKGYLALKFEQATLPPLVD